MPFHTHDEALSIQNIKSKRLSRTFITCTDFGDSMFHSMRSKETDSWGYFELRRGHDSIDYGTRRTIYIIIKDQSNSD